MEPTRDIYLVCVAFHLKIRWNQGAELGNARAEASNGAVVINCDKL